MYDDEAIYQDADIEQWEMEREGNRLAALKRQGICTHGSAVGLGGDGKAHYPEAEGLLPGQVRCTEGCGQVFETREAWDDARAMV